MCTMYIHITFKHACLTFYTNRQTPTHKYDINLMIKHELPQNGTQYYAGYLEIFLLFEDFFF